MTNAYSPDRFLRSRTARTAALCVAVALMSAAFSALMEPESLPRKETIVAVTGSPNLIKLNAGQPHRLLESRPVVGPLGPGPLADATFDIADVSGAAFTAVRTAAQAKTRLYLIDLVSGRATHLGRVGDGAPLLGMAVEP